MRRTGVRRIGIVDTEFEPDGIEPRLDRIAAELWRLAENEARYPDAGRLCRVSHKLRELQGRVRAPRSPPLRDAREAVRKYASQLEPADPNR